MTGIMAITMAGMGSRFTKAGYTVPKYEIEVLGRPLFDWSMLSLTAFRDQKWCFRFVTRKDTGAKPYIMERCQKLGIIVDQIIELNDVTDGQATSALLLTEQANNELPFAVYNIDTYVTPSLMTPPDPSTCDGWIPCFRAPGDGWSFVKLDHKQTVTEVREKVRISDFATLGLYWFKSIQLYRTTYKEHFARPDGIEKGERYIAPIYNRLINDNKKVTITDILLEEVGMLGTPEQVENFLHSPPTSVKEYI